MIHTIDLNFMGTPRSIAAFAIEDKEGLTLVECGPFSTHDALIAGLEAKGFKADDVHTLLLTHIHFDHAGAAWWWAGRGVKVYVHPKGLRHMIDPERLYGSARQIYGDMMDTLWGKMEGIASDQIFEVGDREEITVRGHKWIAHHTPGHAKHHIAWQLGDVVFTGDVGGAKIDGGPVVPPCPPPDIDAEAWKTSIARLRSLDAATFYLTHFGLVSETSQLLDDLERRLDAYIDWIKPYAARGATPDEVVPKFTEYLEAELREEGVSTDTLEAYRKANPPYMSVAGLYRYLSMR